MKSVELMVSILLLIEILIVAADEQLSVSFHDGLNDFEEGEIFPLPFAEILTVELDELEEDAFNDGLCVVAAALLIEQSHQAVKHQSGGHEIVTKVDEFKNSPCVEDGQGRLADP
jgi:hypothetical protein